MILVSFLAIPFVYSDDNNNRYRDDPTSVFAPGYLNAAKYQAEAIVAQQTQPKKSLLQNITEYLQGKTENNVEQNVAVKPTPVLQQKQSSGGGKGKVQTVASAVVSTNINPEDIQVYIRNNIQEYIKQATGTINSDYQLKALDGRYYAVWTAMGADNICSVKAQFFDSQGNPVSSAPVTLTGSANYARIEDVSIFANGNFSVFWSEYETVDGDTVSPYSLKTQFFDSQGKALSTSPVMLGERMGDERIDNVSILSNGNMAVVWDEWGYYGYMVRMQFLNSQGSAISTMPLTLTGNGGLRNVSILSNDNVAVFWYESDPNNNMSADLKAQFFDSKGGVLSAPVTFQGIRFNYAYHDDVSILSNGDVAVFWNQYDSNFNETFKAQFFHSNGSPKSAPVTLSGGIGFSIAYIDNVSILSNGNIAVFWNDTDGGNTHSFLKAQFFDSKGKPTLQAPLTLGEDMPFTGLVNVSLLSNGDVAVFWNESNWHLNIGSSKEQFFDSQGKAIFQTPVTLSEGNYSNACIDNVSVLSNGDFAILWGGRDSNNNYFLKEQILDSQGRPTSQAPVTLDEGMDYKMLNNVSVLSNGDVAVSWWSGDGLKVQFLDPQGRVMSEASVTLTTSSNLYMPLNISVLSNGDMTVFWGDYDSNWNETLKAQFFDSQGNALSAAPVIIGGVMSSVNIDNVSTLSNGDVAVFWNGADSNGNYTFGTQVFDSQGTYLPIGSLNPYVSANASLTNSGAVVADSYVHDPLTTYYNIAKDSISISNTTSYDADNSGGILKTLLTNDNPMLKGVATGTEAQGAFQLALTDALKGSALALPQGQIPQADMEVAMRLASILNNPTDDQKALLDVIKSLLVDTDKVREGAANANPALVKAQNDLLQAVANILLAQGIPDLLKQGDMSNVKGIFSELDTQKNKIMLEYVRSTKPYYENTLKDLARNIAVLQLKNILKPGTTQEDLDKLPPSELDKILEKIKKEENRTFEEEYILQQEAKYRKTYLEPSQKKLSEEMKGMLNDFTSKINDVLKTADRK